MQSFMTPVSGSESISPWRQLELSIEYMSAWNSSQWLIAFCMLTIISAFVVRGFITTTGRIQKLSGAVRTTAEPQQPLEEEDQSSRPSSSASEIQASNAEANPHPTDAKDLPRYESLFIPLNIILKTATETHVRTTNLNQSELAAFACNLKQRHPTIDVFSLSTRSGCIIIEAQLLSSSDRVPPLLLSDFVNNLCLEQEYWDPTEVKRVRVLTSHGGSSIYVFNEATLSWELDPGSISAPESQHLLSLGSLVISHGQDAPSVKISAFWDGPSLPKDSSIEAVLAGRALPMSCFPEPSSWIKGSEIKIKLDLKSLKPDDGGMIYINVWSPSSEKGSPSILVTSASLLLLPNSAQGAVDELIKVLARANGSPSQPFGSLQHLVQDIALILLGASSSSNISHPATVKDLIKASKAVVDWSTECHCLSLCQLMMKATSLLSPGPMHRISSFVRVMVFQPWKSYEINLIWATLFSSALCLGALKAFLSSSYHEVALLLVQAWPYLLAIVLKLTTTHHHESHRFLKSAGLVLSLNREIVGFVVLCFGRWQPVVLKKWFQGDWVSFSVGYLLSKPLYTLFEPFDLRAFILLNLLIDAAEVSWMGTMSGYTTFPAIFFGFASISFSICVRLLMERWWLQTDIVSRAKKSN